MNPISGTVRKSGIAKLIDKDIDRDCYDYSILETQYKGHASELAENAKSSGIDVVVAVGGDGTVNEVARAIKDSDTVLGIIPCGSGNGLARHLMIPLDFRKSIEIINMHCIHELDYGKINDIPFFCTCGMGFDAYISMKFAEAGKRGPMTYLEQIIKEGFRYKSEKYVIEENGREETYRAFLISCANASQYGNNAYIAPHASMSDGLLDVIIIEPFDVIEAPQISIDMFNKTLDKNAKVKTMKVKDIHIRRERPGYIHYDGDPVMAGTDLQISIVSKGIKVIVNPLANKSKRQPNLVQNAFSGFFNDINIMRADITRQGHNIQALNSTLLKKLNNL